MTGDELTRKILTSNRPRQPAIGDPCDGPPSSVKDRSNKARPVPDDGADSPPSPPFRGSRVSTRRGPLLVLHRSLQIHQA
jgi:hypothetical protein